MFLCLCYLCGERRFSFCHRSARQSKRQQYWSRRRCQLKIIVAWLINRIRRPIYRGDVTARAGALSIHQSDRRATDGSFSWFDPSFRPQPIDTVPANLPPERGRRRGSISTSVTSSEGNGATMECRRCCYESYSLCFCVDVCRYWWVHLHADHYFTNITPQSLPISSTEQKSAIMCITKTKERIGPKFWLLSSNFSP